MLRKWLVWNTTHHKQHIIRLSRFIMRWKHINKLHHNVHSTCRNSKTDVFVTFVSSYDLNRYESLSISFNIFLAFYVSSFVFLRFPWRENKKFNCFNFNRNLQKKLNILDAYTNILLELYIMTIQYRNTCMRGKNYKKQNDEKEKGKNMMKYWNVLYRRVRRVIFSPNQTW